MDDNATAYSRHVAHVEAERQRLVDRWEAQAAKIIALEARVAELDAEVADFMDDTEHDLLVSRHYYLRKKADAMADAGDQLLTAVGSCVEVLTDPIEGSARSLKNAVRAAKNASDKWERVFAAYRYFTAALAAHSAGEDKS